MPELKHQPVMLMEAVDALDINGQRAEGIYIDATFGRGGHSRLILERLGSNGRLIAFDKDVAAVEAARKIRDPRFEIVHRSFADLDVVLEERGIETLDGILLDLGISSPQVDDATRGFSFRLPGPLDMRMDTTQGMSAKEWLASESVQKIAEVIREYGEERFAVQISKAIVDGRSVRPITCTRQLADIVAKAVKTRGKGKDPATRTFQAVRIYINRELEDLEIALDKAWERLAPNGKMAVISFHSLEDRMVKHFFKKHAETAQPDRRLPIRANELPQAQMKLLGKKKPGKEEVENNPRSRSAVLRVAGRIANGNPDTQG